MMLYTLYPSEEAALLAAGEWVRNMRADWELLPRKNWTRVDPALVLPCDRPRLTGARLDGFTIRARGASPRCGGTTALFAAVWEAPR